MPVARRAGIQQASNATSIRIAGTTTNVIESAAPAENNMLRTALEASTAAAVPARIPIPTNRVNRCKPGCKPGTDWSEPQN